MASSSASYDALGINWGPWRQLSNSQWHRKGQDSAGNWFEDNQNEDPRQHFSIKELSLSFGSDSSLDIRHPYQEDQDEVPEQPSSIKESGQSLGSDSLIDVTWGKWAPLSNGQLQRVGRDLQGKWHKELQDEGSSVPGQPHSTSESSQSSDLDHSTRENYLHDLHDSGYVSIQSYAKSSRSSMSDIEPHGKSSRASSPDAKGKGREIDPQPSVGLSSERNSSDATDSGYDLPTATDKEGESIQNFDFDRSTGDTEMRDSGHRSRQSHTHKSKSSRPFEGDFKSQSKNSRSSRSYHPKLKGGEIEQHPMVISSSSHSGGGAEELGYGLPIATDKEGESSFSSTAISDLGYYAPADEYEATDLVSELPGPSSYRQGRPKTKMVSGVPYHEDFTRYTPQPSRKFTFGTVFKVMWSEPMGISRLSKHNKDPVGTGMSISEFGMREHNGTILYEGIRRFIVVDGNENGARLGNSICLPIATYKKQGCTKHGIKPHQHGIIYTHDKTPMLLNNEPELGAPPIRLVVNQELQGIEKLAPESRINYSKHVTIEHNSPIHIIGKIHQDDLKTLEAGVDVQWEKRVRDRKKNKKQERSRGHEQTSSGLKEESSRSAETPRKLAEPHVPDGVEQDGNRPDHNTPEHLGSTFRLIPPSPDSDREEGAKQADHSSPSQTLAEKSAEIHEEPQETHASGSSRVTASDEQNSPEELDSRLDSLAISSNVIQDQISQEYGAENHPPGNVSLRSSSQSSRSSICLTETPADTSIRGPHLTTSQRRQLIVQRLIAHVTTLLQTRTEPRGENTRVHTESSSNPSHDGATSSEAENQATQSNSGTGQPVRPNRKRRLNDQSGEEGSDGEQHSPSGAQKDKQTKGQVLFACPYIKRYGSKAPCKNNGWPSTNRIKAHLYKCHQQAIHCARCYKPFKDRKSLETHSRAPLHLQCDVLDETMRQVRLRGFDEQQEKDLRSREGLFKLNEYDKWRKIYMILFPDKQDEIPDPYFNPKDSHKVLLELDAEDRQELALLLKRASKKLIEEGQEKGKKQKVSHVKGNESEFEDFFNKVVDKAILDEVLDDEAADETCETYSYNADNEHENDKGKGVAAEDPAVQFSFEMGTVGPSCDTVFDDDSNGQLVSFGSDLWQDFLFQEPISSISPNSGPSYPFMGFTTAGPNDQRGTVVDRPASDSGYSSTRSQEPQDLPWPSTILVSIEEEVTEHQ